MAASAGRSCAAVRRQRDDGAAAGDEGARARGRRRSRRRSRTLRRPARWSGRAARRCSPTSSATTFTIDPAAVDAAVTSRTSGIVATHVFGTPCDIDALDAIGRRTRHPGHLRRGAQLRHDVPRALGAVVRRRERRAASTRPRSSTPSKAALLVTRDERRAGTPPSACATSVTSTTRRSTGSGSTPRRPSCTPRWASATSRHLDELLARRRAIHERYRAGWRT